jgi:hypothetical protein
MNREFQDRRLASAGNVSASYYAMFEIPRVSRALRAWRLPNPGSFPNSQLFVAEFLQMYEYLHISTHQGIAFANDE